MFRVCVRDVEEGGRGGEKGKEFGRFGVLGFWGVGEFGGFWVVLLRFGGFLVVGPFGRVDCKI